VTAPMSPGVPPPGPRCCPAARGARHERTSPWPVPASVCASLRAAPDACRGQGTLERVQSAPRGPAKIAGTAADFATALPLSTPVRGLPMEAAVAYSGVPKRRLWALIQTGELPATRIPGMRAVLVLRDVLDRLLERYRTAAPPRSRSRPTGTAYPWARAGGLIGAVDNVWTTVGKSATRCRFGTAGRRGQIGCVQPARPCRSALRPYPRAHLAGPGATFGAGEGSGCPLTPSRACGCH
jgi:hypothetical protein